MVVELKRSNVKEWRSFMMMMESQQCIDAAEAKSENYGKE